MELSVRTGYGYVPAERNKTANMPVGTIPIDSMFSPVRRVNYTVTNARVGQRTDYDKLALELRASERRWLRRLKALTVPEFWEQEGHVGELRLGEVVDGNSTSFDKYAAEQARARQATNAVANADF